MKIVKISEAQKHNENPFLDQNVLQIERGNKSIITGGSNKVLVDVKTGETEAISLLHKFKEVDKTTFVKLYVNEVSALFDLTKAGLKAFGYVIDALKINNDSIYINIQKMMVDCGYKTKKPIYRGLSELVSNKIIAMSKDPNVWFINPNIIFNGNRIAFIKEYEMKKDEKSNQRKLPFK